MHEYLVSQDTQLSKLWIVSKRAPGAAVAWDTDCGLGFFPTAKAAKAALKARAGDSLGPWAITRTSGASFHYASILNWGAEQ